MIKPEILAPAGSNEQLVAAVRAGADAVYMGYGGFSARAGADNPKGDELARAVGYCHERGVSVYVAMNTLILEDEWKSAVLAAQDICKSGADAVIVQDLGLAHLFLQSAPDMPLHASTQMTVHTPAGAVLLASQGFKRIVLARELSKTEMQEIVCSSPVETEVFVHGAMCMSVSGQCYLSSMLGGRSGNRGLCAQPCRLPFSAEGSNGYDLSLKDMSLVGHIPELAKMGVTSLKIEGRLKRPEYVAAAVAACKAAVCGQELSPRLLKNLEAVFSRSGFSDGYFTGKRGKVMFGFRRKDDVTAASSQVFAELHSLYREERRSVDLQASLKAHVGSALEVELSDGKNSVSVSGETVSAAQNAPTSEEQLRKQLCKTGGTPYFIEHADIKMQGNPFVAVTQINALRRSALEQLSALRRQKKVCEFDYRQEELCAHIADKTTIRASFSSIGQIPDSARMCELVFVPLEQCTAQPEAVKKLIESGFNVGVSLPGATFGQEQSIKEMLKKARKIGIESALVQNIGQILPAKDAGMKIHAGQRLNLTNSSSLAAVQALGIEDAALSFELTFSQIDMLGGDIKRGMLVYGHLPLMLTRNCPAANGSKSCAQCGGHGTITDRKGESFDVMCRMGCSELYNPVALCIFDKLNGANADFYMLWFTKESKDKAQQVFKAFAEQKKISGKATNGLYIRGIE